MTLETLEKKRKQLIFRSGHRGMKEMDLIMGSFANKYIQTFTPEEIEQYEIFLDVSDPDLYNWYLRKEEISEKHKHGVSDLFLKHKITD